MTVTFFSFAVGFVELKSVKERSFVCLPYQNKDFF